MDKEHRREVNTRTRKASNPSIRPLNLPKLTKHTSRLIDIEREIQQVRERLFPMM